MVAELRNGSYWARSGRRDNKGSLIPPGARPALDPLSHFEAGSWEESMVGQCRSKLAVRPTKAHAVLFYSQHPDGGLDASSKHGGCPVIKGQKWAANLWIWNKVPLLAPPRPIGATLASWPL